MRVYPSLFCAHPPTLSHLGGSSRAQPQLAPQRYCARHAPACSGCRFSTLHHVPPCTLTGCTHCILQGPAAAAPQRHCAQHASACRECCDRSQPGNVCRSHLGNVRRIAHQPDADCILPPPMPSIVSRLAGNTPGAWSNTRVDHGGHVRRLRRGVQTRGKDTRCLSPCTPEP